MRVAGFLLGVTSSLRRVAMTSVAASWFLVGCQGSGSSRPERQPVPVDASAWDNGAMTVDPEMIALDGWGVYGSTDYAIVVDAYSAGRSGDTGGASAIRVISTAIVTGACGVFLWRRGVRDRLTIWLLLVSFAMLVMGIVGAF